VTERLTALVQLILRYMSLLKNLVVVEGIQKYYVVWKLVFNHPIYKTSLYIASYTRKIQDFLRFLRIFSYHLQPDPQVAPSHHLF